MDQKFHIFDVVVIGSGISGLNTARYLKDNLKVAIITKTFLGDGSSRLAQGGIAAVSKDHSEDSFNSHINDTISVGANLCNKEVVEFCVKKGPFVIDNLINLGVKFSLRDKKTYDLTKEGGHSHRRIYHIDDVTGEAIVEGLKKSVLKENIKIFEDNIAINLIKNEKGRVIGVFTLEKNNVINIFISKFVVLATGGAGKAYLYTSNPDVITGDGIAMAYRAGACITNMEFFQFHPTCLYHQKVQNFLISESMRGEGGVLRLKNGEKFTHKYDPRAELAPRDVVARAIDSELKASGDKCVFLDITHKDSNFLIKRFPNIYAKCKEAGIDITKDWIPVVPAAHYLCGGVKVDMTGKTDLKGLYACGEVAHTGLHGANRLASNSLLETMVFSYEVAKDINSYVDDVPLPKEKPVWESHWVEEPEETILVHNNWQELRLNMWNNVGIVRTIDRLKNALKRVEIIKQETSSYYWKYKLTKDIVELRNLIVVSECIINSAMMRKESRGLHYIKNFPRTNDAYNTNTDVYKST